MYLVYRTSFISGDIRGALYEVIYEICLVYASFMPRLSNAATLNDLSLTIEAEALQARPARTGIIPDRFYLFHIFSGERSSFT